MYSLWRSCQLVSSFQMPNFRHHQYHSMYCNHNIQLVESLNIYITDQEECITILPEVGAQQNVRSIRQGGLLGSTTAGFRNAHILSCKSELMQTVNTGSRTEACGQNEPFESWSHQDGHLFFICCCQPLTKKAFHLCLHRVAHHLDFHLHCLHVLVFLYAAKFVLIFAAYFGG